MPTCHVVFGEATAILAGDSLLTHGLGALRAVSEAPRSIAAAKVRVLQTVVEAIGTQGMIGGQMADIEAESEASPTAEPLDAHPREQDGPPDRAPPLTGDPRRRRRGDARARDLYGRRIGLAFQIKDDLLDVESDAATPGKASSKDAAVARPRSRWRRAWTVASLLAEDIAAAVAAARRCRARAGSAELARLDRAPGSREGVRPVGSPGTLRRNRARPAAARRRDRPARAARR